MDNTPTEISIQLTRLQAWWTRRGRRLARFTGAVLAMSCSGANPTSPGGPPAPLGPTAIHITPSSLTLATDSLLTLSLTADRGALARPTWLVRDTTVAKIDDNGTLTALSRGNTHVLANSSGLSDSTTLSVIDRPVATLVLLPNPVKITVGDTITLRDTAKDDHGHPVPSPLTWAISDTTISTLSPTGHLHAITNGSATITATAGKVSSSIPIIVISSSSLSSVQLSMGATTLAVDSSLTVAATALDSKGIPMSSAPPTWSSSNPAVATVTNGLIKALVPGTTDIRAQIGGVAASLALTVTPRALTSITLTPSSLTLAVAATAPLAVTVKNDQGQTVPPNTLSPILWAPDDSSVAKVTSGLVLGVRSGTTTIRASLGTLVGTSNITVTGPRTGAAASINIAPTSITLAVDSTMLLTATVVDANGKVVTGAPITWSSENTGLVTVSTDGHILAIAPGTANIRAATPLGASTISATTSVIALARPLSTITLAPTTLSIVALDSATVSLSLKDTRGNSVSLPVTWSSSNPGVATATSPQASISRVYTNLAGIATLTATAGGKSATLAVTVLPTGPLSSVGLAPSSVPSMPVGTSLQLTATGRDAKSRIIAADTAHWSSSNPSVTVSSTGLLTAQTVGTSTVTATLGSYSASVGVTTVPGVPASLTLSPTALSIGLPDSARIIPTVKDARGNTISPTVSWATSNPSVALVTLGQVKSVGAGSAAITATAPPVSAQATVTVTAPAARDPECASPKAGWIFCDDFELDRTSSYFETDNAQGRFTRTHAVGLNGSTGMLAHWNTGSVGAGSLHLAFGRTPSSYMRPADAGTADYREIYWRLYLKNQTGWTGGGGDKLSRALVFAGSNFAEAALAHVWSAGQGGNYLYLDPASGTDTDGNLKTTGYNDFANMRWLGATGSTTPIFDAAHVGQWHCVEAHVRLNDAGQSNGLFELWIDGSLETSHTSINWLGNYSAYGLNAVYVENYWNAGSPVSQERYIDNFVVSTTKIGCNP